MNLHLGMGMGESVYDPDTGSWVEMEVLAVNPRVYASGSATVSPTLVVGSVAPGVPVVAPRVFGPELPPGFVAAPFNCPPGSNFDASQRIGMCVDAASNPIYSRGGGGMWSYYALDGSSWEVDPITGAPKPKSLIPGIDNLYVYAAAGVLALMLFMKARR